MTYLDEMRRLWAADEDFVALRSRQYPASIYQPATVLYGEGHTPKQRADALERLRMQYGTMLRIDA